MLELRKMNYKDIKQQWEYVTALPADENGLTNPYEGVSYEEYVSEKMHCGNIIFILMRGDRL